MIEWLRVTASRLRAVFDKQNLDRDFDDELREHLALLSEEFEAGGMAPGEARRAAVLKLGYPGQLREANREHRGMLVIEQFAQDLRFAMRTLTKDRGFTALAALSLALGIGANTAVFSLVDTLLLRPLPVKEPGRLVTIQRMMAAGGFSKPGPIPSTAPELMKDQRTVFSDVMGYLPISRPVVTIDGSPEADRSVWQVTRNFFPGLGVPAAIGTVSHEGPSAVIAYEMWQTRFNGSPQVLGRALTVDEQVYTITGVAPKNFHGLSIDASTDVWLLTTFPPPYAPYLLGRLQPRIPVRQAEAAVDVVFRQSDQQPGSAAFRIGPGISRTTEVIPATGGLSYLREQYRRPLLAIMALVILVMLITCANIGNLLLVRNTKRTRELTVRAALGARRSRLITQLLVESAVLAAVGGTLAWVVARWGVSAILAMLPVSRIPEQLEFQMDARIFAFTAAVSLLSAILFALAPAWRGTRVDITTGLKAASGRATEQGARRLGRWLVAGQIALSVLLLTGAGLFLQTLRNLAQTDPGFDTHNLLQVEIDTRGSGYGQGKVSAVYKLLLERLAMIPGVQSVTGIRNPVMVGAMTTGFVTVGSSEVTVATGEVGPHFFETLRIPVLRGRGFSQADATRLDTAAVVVSEAYANEISPGEDIIGKRTPGGVTGEIIGIVKDTKMTALRGEIRPTMYGLALRKEPDRVSAIVIRTAGAPGTLTPAIRKAVMDVNPRLLVAIRTMKELMERSMARERMVAATAGFFGSLGLVLAAIGVFGVASFTVAQRTSELGIRIALGAGRWHVVRESLRETAAVFGVGMIAGCVLAVAGARIAASLLSTLLFGLTATDWTNIVGAGAVMLTVALAACAIPALKAVRVDPLQAIRYE